MTMRPNPHCQNYHCRQRQQEAQEAKKLELAFEQQQKKQSNKTEAIFHEDNQWGISVVGGSVVLEESLEVSEGLHLAYSPPPSSTEQGGVEGSAEDSIQDLMEQLKNV
jgi:hypothetical protein